MIQFHVPNGIIAKEMQDAIEKFDAKEYYTPSLKEPVEKVKLVKKKKAKTKHFRLSVNYTKEEAERALVSMRNSDERNPSNVYKRNIENLLEFLNDFDQE